MKKLTRWQLMVSGLVLALLCVASASIAKEPALTIRKSPFSSSSYHLWKEPHRGATPRAVERVIRRNPPVGAQSQQLEQQGGHFTSDRKAPYAKPAATRPAH